MEAMTPSCLKRGMSAGSTTWACSMRLRAVRETAGLRVRVESHGGGLVADGVEAKLEAGLRALDGHSVELRLRVLRQAGVAGIVGEGRFHGRGARAERAIHEALQKAGVQHGIVQVVVGAHLDQLGQRIFEGQPLA